MPDTPILPTLPDERIKQAITDAKSIVHDMELDMEYDVAFRVVLQRKMDDAYAQLTLENALLIQSIGKLIE